MKKILVLGGTSFLGRVLVEELTSTDNSITIFNRGKTNKDLFPETRKLHGDRLTDDINVLGKENWDVVFDLSCFHPVHLEKLLQVVKGNVGRYIFVSSISSLDLESSAARSIIDESTPLLGCTEEEKVSGDIMATYGQKKAECERIITRCDWLDSIILRPSLIYGKYDFSDRVYYWLRRVKSHKEILVPENGGRIIGMTYVEDLARAMISAMDVTRHLPAYNTGTHAPIALSELLHIASSVFGVCPLYVNASSVFLTNNGVREWVDIPLWINGVDFNLDTAKFFNDFPWERFGFEESIRRTIGFYEQSGWNEGKYGISDSREQELIGAIVKDKSAN